MPDEHSHHFRRPLPPVAGGSIESQHAKMRRKLIAQQKRIDAGRYHCRSFGHPVKKAG